MPHTDSLRRKYHLSSNKQIPTHPDLSCNATTTKSRRRTAPYTALTAPNTPQTKTKRWRPGWHSCCHLATDFKASFDSPHGAPGCQDPTLMKHIKVGYRRARGRMSALYVLLSRKIIETPSRFSVYLAYQIHFWRAVTDMWTFPVTIRPELLQQSFLFIYNK